jgi:hypothetical protein
MPHPKARLCDRFGRKELNSQYFAPWRRVRRLYAAASAQRKKVALSKEPSLAPNGGCFDDTRYAEWQEGAHMCAIPDSGPLTVCQRLTRLGSARLRCESFVAARR